MTPETRRAAIGGTMSYRKCASCGRLLWHMRRGPFRWLHCARCD